MPYARQKFVWLLVLSFALGGPRCAVIVAAHIT